MKIFIAFTLVMSGIPILIGHIFGQLCSMPIFHIVELNRRGKGMQPKQPKPAWIFHGGADMTLKDCIPPACRYLFSGFGAILAAGFIFHLFGLQLPRSFGPRPMIDLKIKMLC
jgi:hypothetical protein